MKAKIKATGEIVHVGDYNTISHDPMYKNERTGPWRLEELDFNDTADYWTKLRHQAAIAAMQGKMAQGDNFGNSREDVCNKIVDYCIDVADTLINKLMEERK